MVAATGGKRLGVNLERCTDSAEHTLGEIIEGTAGRKYRYVQFKDAVTYVAGHLVTLASASDWAVTNDRAGGSSLAAHIPVGVVFQTVVPTQDQYGWVQISGIASVLHEGAAVAIGDRLVADPTNDGAVSEADYTAVAHLDLLTVGIALAATGDGANGNVLLDLPQ